MKTFWPDFYLVNVFVINTFRFKVLPHSGLEVKVNLHGVVGFNLILNQ